MTMITPSYLGETIEYSSLHACRSTLEDPTRFSFSCNPVHTDKTESLIHGLTAHAVALFASRAQHQVFEHGLCGLICRLIGCSGCREA